MPYNVKQKWHNLPPRTLMGIAKLVVMGFAWHITQDNGHWAWSFHSTYSLCLLSETLSICCTPLFLSEKSPTHLFPSCTQGDLCKPVTNREEKTHQIPTYLTLSDFVDNPLLWRPWNAVWLIHEWSKKNFHVYSLMDVMGLMGFDAFVGNLVMIVLWVGWWWWWWWWWCPQLDSLLLFSVVVVVAVQSFLIWKFGVFSVSAAVLCKKVK